MNSIVQFRLNMEDSQKLSSAKETLQYMMELFPQCFIKEGEAKPLKIGIFQDLSERLADDPKVSKTLLRSALRQYTSAWRYLHGVKSGQERVDLDGNNVGPVEQQHIEHATKTLEESKAKFNARKKELQKERAAQENNKKPDNKSSINPKFKKKTYTSKKRNKNATKVEETSKLSINDVLVDKKVNVNLGQGNVPAIVLEVHKNDIKVRLSNGLIMNVKAEHIFA